MGKLKAKKNFFGQYVVINWSRDNDEENIKNIAGAMRELMKAARASDVSIIENSIYLVVQGDERFKKDPFGYERHYLSDNQMTVGLRFEGTTWVEE